MSNLTEINGKKYGFNISPMLGGVHAEVYYLKYVPEWGREMQMHVCSKLFSKMFRTTQSEADFSKARDWALTIILRIKKSNSI